MQYNFIRVENEGFTCNLTLARAEKRNAFTPTMVNEIAHALAIAHADPAVKLLILRAEGPVFCAGMDLKTFRDPLLDITNPHIKNSDVSLGEVMERFHKPSIAVVEGDVVAGAFLLILGCTYVLSAASVRFRLPEIELGIFPFQVMASLMKVMPEKKMLQLCLDSSYFDVSKALGLGIVDEILEEGTLERYKLLFADKQTDALMAGIAACRTLPTIAAADRFSFLKKSLEQLRDGKI